VSENEIGKARESEEVVVCLVEEGREETKPEAPFVESSKRPLSSLADPLYLQTLTSPSIPPERGLNFSQRCQSLMKVSLVM
jgi:hypothetical protein